MQTLTIKEMSKLHNCGTDKIRTYLRDNNLYEDYCKYHNQICRYTPLVCCICGETKQVSKLKGKSYCKKHYNHIFRYGEVVDKTIYDKNDYEFDYENSICKIILRDKYQNINGICEIDIEDYEKVKIYKWYLSHGYCKTKGINKNSGVNIHNVIMDNLDNIDIIIFDHQDKNKLNNHKSNLRQASSQENAMNMGMKNTNKSGVTGVQKYTRDKILKWSASITHKYKSIYLGRFINFDDAVICRLKGEAQYFKEYSPNYNINKQLISITYLSLNDYLYHTVEVDLEGNIVTNIISKAA